MWNCKLKDLEPNVNPKRKSRKDISCLSKSHLRLLAAEESELICNSLFNTTVSLHTDNDKYSNKKHLGNNSIFNAHMTKERNETPAPEGIFMNNVTLMNLWNMKMTNVYN